jgi:2-dehydropantoate 2-reductase
MRIAIFGVGGAGGYFGARLAQAGEDVFFIARGKHLEAMRKHGLRVDSILGDVVVSPVQATDNPAEVGPVDMILLGVKAWQVSEAAQAAQPMVGPETVVVPLQNGVEAPAQIQKALGSRHAVGGLARIISYKVGDGHIRHAGADPFIALGELNSEPSERIQRIRDVLQQAGISAEIPPDIQAALWQKFLFVVSWGGVGTIADAPIGVIRSVPETRHMLEQAMAEVLALAKARDIALADDTVKNTMAFVDTLPEDGSTSLHRDIKGGRPSELEFWNGAVVRLGQAAGIKTPVHTVIYGSLLPRELRAQGRVRF